jgi:hypothetical protein
MGACQACRAKLGGSDAQMFAYANSERSPLGSRRERLDAVDDFRHVQIHGGAQQQSASGTRFVATMKLSIPHALQCAQFGLIPIASTSDARAFSRDSQPDARIPASSKDMLLVRPSSKLCGRASCIPRRADSTRQCALSRRTSPPPSRTASPPDAVRRTLRVWRYRQQ